MFERLTKWRNLAVVLAALIAAGAPNPVLALDEKEKQPARRDRVQVADEPQAPPDDAPPMSFEREIEEQVKSTAVASDDEPPVLPVVGGTWVAQGPGPITGGQVEGITNSPVSGAIQTIVAHPTNADIAWLGAVNGGIWKTTNATSATPTWVSAGDAFASLSMGALERDPTDATHNTIVGASGRFSSFSRVGGPRGVLMRTTNGGTNWTATTPATLSGKNVSGLAARGATIVVSVNIADSFTCSNIGIFRSTDTGATFTRISGAGGSGLPSSSSFDLVSDPSNNAVLYTATGNSVACSGSGNGIYRSTDTGATWTKVSSAAMDTLMASDAVVNNTRIAVGLSGQVYVGIINNGRLAGLFRSANGTTNWVQLDSPSTNEGGTAYGMQPREKPGAQGSIHFSIVADPTDANIVYLGGDRQPGAGDPGIPAFPNSIGANSYTGRLFRVNASLAPGSQAVPLTHCQSAPAACSSIQSTASNSAPHADSRRMVFDANGNILEGDDGGIYRRTVPRGTGDWFSMNGNLQVTEAHDVVWDTVSNMIMTGNQDNGTSEQRTVGAVSWSSVSTGDGGDASADDVTSATESTRYSSFQNLGSFRRRTVNASGTTTATAFPARTVTGGGPAFEAQFVTPVELNAITPTRILFAGNNDLYESLDRGDTITALGFNLSSPAIVYGGRSQGVDNPALIYSLCTVTTVPCTTNRVYVRTSGSGAPVQTATNPGSSALRDIAVNPADWRNAFVINSAGEVYSTPDTGATWTNITGDLGGGSTDLRTIAFVPGSPNAVVVGGTNGVFRMATTNVGVWNQFGSGLTNAPVWDLDYDPADDVLVAGTMGRGTWKLTPTNLGPLPTLSINDVTVTEGNAGTTNATFTVTLSAAAGQVSVNYATADGTAVAAGATNVSNSAAITISQLGNATPYPSTINASGLTGTITNVTATLTGFTHTYCTDVDVLLVGPAGQSVVLMSDVGSPGNQSSVTITFDDAGPAIPSTAFTTGTYRPTNVADGQGADIYSSPAPGSGYGSTLSVFNGTAPNGTWSLYVVDDVFGDSGTVSGGWSLGITTNGGDYLSTSGTLTILAGNTTKTITVPVNGDATQEPNETFVVNLTAPTNATIADAQGVGTITNDDGLLPPTNVVAAATGATTVNVLWTLAGGATSYRVYRSANGSTYTLVGSPSTSPFNDTTALANTAYLYKVRSFNGVESGDSNIDLATTILFTDDPLSATVTTVKTLHFTEALAAVNAVRTLAGLGGVAFTAPAPGSGVTVRRQHLLDLRGGLDPARTQLVLTAISYGETITAGSTTVKVSHLNEIRNGVK